MDQPELVDGDGPIGLILAPTRELAAQIYTETKKFCKVYGLQVGIAVVPFVRGSVGDVRLPSQLVFATCMG
jgi:superfamily II DNA/RNA helicase